MGSADSKSKLNYLQIINIITYGAIILINVLSTLGQIGETNVAVSNKFPSYFTPAGYGFSIWGFIFATLGCFTIYQALPKNSSNPKLYKIHLLFMFSALGMFGWIFSFNFMVIWVSQVMIFWNWLALAVLCFRLFDFGFLKAPKFDTLDYWLYNVPFSIFIGWLTVANIANFFILAVDQGWPYVNEPLSAAVALAIVAVIGLAALVFYSDIFYVLVLIWAIVAIRVKEINNETIASSALSCLIFLGGAEVITLVSILVKFFQNRKKQNKKMKKMTKDQVPV